MKSTIRLNRNSIYLLLKCILQNFLYAYKFSFGLVNSMRWCWEGNIGKRTKHTLIRENWVEKKKSLVAERMWITFDG